MKHLLAALVTAATAAGFPAAEAAQLTVSPIAVQMAPGQTNAQITATAGPEAAVPVQARVFRWIQTNGKDELLPTSDVVASPPAATVPAGQQGVLRIIRVANDPVVQEESYRVLIDQIPQAQGSQGTGITMAMRHSIPIFITPAGWTAPELNWAARRDGSRLVLTATNTGGTRAKITGLSLADGATGTNITESGLIGYVLAGSSRTWEFDVSGGSFPSGGAVGIAVTTGAGGRSDATVAIQ